VNRLFIIASFMLTISFIAPSPAQAQGNDVLRDTFGSWEIRCIEGTDTCAMSQVGNTTDGKRALLVTIQRVIVQTDNGTPVPAAMTVQTPLGILLPYGVRLKIDSNDVVPMPLSRCIPAGCISQAPISDKAVDQMKRGSKAVFGFFLTNEVLVNVSLSGFTKAYNSLTPVRPQQ
jgi:invasion protein IalB